MRVVGIIAEYNPFHNGHCYQLQKARDLTGADYVIVIMSGDFVQRGEPAIMDKYHRAEACLSCGADVVFELPTAFACASAELFAEGAVSLLNALHVVDDLVFGSECGDLSLLQYLAASLITEPFIFKQVLSDSLKQGNTFPVARKKALYALLSSQKEDGVSSCEPDELVSLLDSPNNLLAVEYLKCLLRTGSKITPCTIKRSDSGYHTETLFDGFSSATALRLSLMNDSSHRKPDELWKKQVPAEALSLFQPSYQTTWPIAPDDLSVLLQYRLLQMNIDFTQYLDVSDDINRRIMKMIPSVASFSSFAEELKTKQLTLSRCKRCLLAILLGIEKSLLADSRQAGFAHYARLLGFRKESSELIREIMNHSEIPVINKLADYKPTDHTTGRLLSLDIRSSELYSLICASKYNVTLPNEFLRGVIIK